MKTLFVCFLPHLNLALIVEHVRKKIYVYNVYLLAHSGGTHAESCLWYFLRICGFTPILFIFLSLIHTITLLYLNDLNSVYRYRQSWYANAMHLQPCLSPTPQEL